MPRSRTTSPVPQGTDISNSFVPGVTLTPSTPDGKNNGGSGGTNNSASSNVRNKKQKYMKPRIGTNFQAKIEPFSGDVAKSTIQQREIEREKGPIGGYINHNCDSLVGGEYGLHGGLFAYQSTTFTNGGYGFGAVGERSYTHNGYGRRKKAGRPPKNGKGGKVSLFNNSQPIYYDSDIKPPSGGLCIHRPTNRISDRQQSQQSHDDFLMFARNITLQAPMSKEEYQVHSQFSKENLNTFSYQRINYLFNEVIERYSMKQKGGGGDNKCEERHGMQIGQKRKAFHITTSSIENTAKRNASPTSNDTPTTQSAAAATALAPIPSNNLTENNASANPLHDNSNNMGRNIKTRKRAQDRVALGLEEDERFLHFLHHTHNGNIKRAKFYMLSHLSQGRAVKTRRYLKKMKKEDEMDVPLSAMLAPLSDSWRRRYERIGFSSTILGDHRRSKNKNEYPYVKNVIMTEGKILQSLSSSLYPWDQNLAKDGDHRLKNNMGEKQEATCLTTSSEDIQGEKILEAFQHDEGFMKDWKSILKIGQDIASQLVQSSSPQKISNSVKLQDLMIILARSYCMPKPEDVFGRRDLISKQISQCLNLILDNVEFARGLIAHLSDAIHERNEEGIDIQKLSKMIDSRSEKCFLRVEEIEIVQQMLKEANEWESRLNTSIADENTENISFSRNLNLPEQSLANAEELALCGRTLSLRPQSLPLLDERIQRAYDLRNRIREWTDSKNNSNDKDSVKYVASMIKEANEIDLGFPELSVLSKVHKSSEEWVDRASVALRSKISLHELAKLVKIGKELPLGLTGTLEKLSTRLEQACHWIERLKIEVPSPLDDMDSTGSNLQINHLSIWMQRMLESLRGQNEEKVEELIELASEGARLPVDINILKLLQIAIDSKNWSSKAENWLPHVGVQFKKGKIDDLRDHLDSAEVIVNQVESLTNEESNWHLLYHLEIRNIVSQADKWHEKYQSILENDNRRAQSKCAISFVKLKEIIDSADTIPVNLGAPYSKVNRMYCEAKTWIENFHHLLLNCGILENHPVSLSSPPKGKISLDQANKAIESASNDVTIELNEVIELKTLVRQSQHWFDRAIEFAPKRNKRIVRGKKDKQDPIVKSSVKEVIELIDTAPKIPMDTTEDLGRLRMLLSDVQSWRLQAQVCLREIACAFNLLRGERIRFYGEPDLFLHQVNDSLMLEPTHSAIDITLGRSDKDVTAPNQSDEANLESYDSMIGDTSKSTVKVTLANGGKDVYKMISSLIKSAEMIPIISFEEQVSEQLGLVSKWCKKVALLIASHNDVYTNKRWRKDLDTFIVEGENLKLLEGFSVVLTGNDTEETKLLDEVKKSVSQFISNDIERLKILRIHRDNFYAWCDKVSEAYSDGDKKIPLEALKTFAVESEAYPQGAETVKQVRKDASNAVAWVQSVAEVISTGKKFTLTDAKNKLDIGNRLKFTCPEYCELKESYQNVKAWTKKVKKSGLNEGSAQIYKIKELIREHDSFLISMPEEVEALKSAMCSYCICRRPYEGFMIGCDECDEWFHGHCVGVSQSQSNRIDKYLCIRCCVTKVCKSSSNSIATVIQKWCDPKELTKSRSQDSQKHQRKIREKKREIMKWKEELQTNVTSLRELKAEEIRQLSLSATLQQSPPEIQTSSPLSPKITEVNGNIVKATTALEQCNQKLEELALLSKERKSLQEKEDSMHNAFRYWCLLIRCKVLTPEKAVLAEASRPSPPLNCNDVSELLSDPMSEIISLAVDYGINGFPDTMAVKNSLECICWGHLALSILKRRPKFEEIKMLVDLSNQLKLPEMKSIGMMRSMLSRTCAWQTKVSKALSLHGGTKQCKPAVLNELRIGLNAIPLCSSQETSLINVIEGGCEEKCQALNGSVDLCDISPHAPDPLELWPPFGLANSPEALKALGILSLTLKVENLQEPVHPSKIAMKASNQPVRRPNQSGTNSQPKITASAHFKANSFGLPNTSKVPIEVPRHENGDALHNSNILKLPTKRSNRTVGVKTESNSKLPVVNGPILNTQQAAADAIRAAMSVNPQVFEESMSSPKNINGTRTITTNTTVNTPAHNSSIYNVDTRNVINAKEAVEVAVRAALASSAMFKPAAAESHISKAVIAAESSSSPFLTSSSSMGKSLEPLCVKANPTPSVNNVPKANTKANLVQTKTAQVYTKDTTKVNNHMILNKVPTLKMTKGTPTPKPKVKITKIPSTPNHIKGLNTFVDSAKINVNTTLGPKQTLPTSSKIVTTQSISSSTSTRDQPSTDQTIQIKIPVKVVPTTTTLPLTSTTSQHSLSNQAAQVKSPHLTVTAKTTVSSRPTQPQANQKAQVKSPGKSSVLMKKFG